jgi:hypothetical protein
MSQADELLNSLTEDSTEVLLDGNIRIDGNRHITVPESLKKLGVQYDHDVTTVTFDCPRYCDGHDLSKMRVYVNYMRPDGMLGAYLCQNVMVDKNDNDIFHFDWTISGNVTEVNGSISFLVCIKNVDNDGYEVNHWNSELNTEMYVSEGMNCADPIIRRYPDIISTLLEEASRESLLRKLNECLATEETTQQTIYDSVTAYLGSSEAVIDAAEEAVTNYLLENPDKVFSVMTAEDIAAVCT